nr:hypothetical protein [Tanacetum cinerariifolium]
MGDADINTLTMKQYLALTRENQAPGVVKTEIRGNLEEIHNFKQEGDETFYQAWKRSTSRNVTNGSLVGITAITKDKSVKEFKYEDFGRPFLNNNENGARYRVGPPRYYTRMDNQPQYEERKLSLTEMITKCMKELAKKEAEHDEWLKKFQECTKINQRGHDEITCNLESKVRALIGEVEGRATRTKMGECKAIFTKEGLPICSKLDQGKPWEIKVLEEPNKERDIDLSLVIKLKEHWCKAILQQKGEGHEFWASCDPYDDQCDGGELPDNTELKCYWFCLNDDKRLDVAWEGLSFNDFEFDENQDNMIDMNVDLPQEINPNTEEDCKNLENFREEKMELILDTLLDKLDDGWFSRTVKDEEDLDGIIDYLELKSHDGFIDIDDEAYK